MLGRVNTFLKPRFVRYAAEFTGKARALGLQTIAEGSALGFIMAFWWRSTHVAEKAKYDKYYAQLRAEQLALGGEE